MVLEYFKSFGIVDIILLNTIHLKSVIYVEECA